MAEKLTKNEESWNKIFDKHKIIEHLQGSDVFQITANQIKEFREPRLMTKFDHRANLPQIFKENNLAILPNTRGTYLIGKFNAYQDIEQNRKSPLTKIPSTKIPLQTIEYNNLYSESSALLCAYNTGIIAEVAGLENPDDCFFTVNGRMSTQKFDYQINLANSNAYNFSVLNSQCEIDAGFETEDKFFIVEAKNYMVDDFLIRQLYYPYRLWASKIQKEVVPIFMCYSNNVFTFFTYKFDNKEEYSSIRLVDKKSYVIGTNTSITIQDLRQICENIKIEPEPEKIPFPQADKFERVVDLLSLLFSKEMTKEDITTNYDFESRQTNYYVDALRYLGLVEKTKYELNQEAESILLKSQTEKYLAIVKRILSRKVFNQAFRLYLQNNGVWDKEQVINLIVEADIKSVKGENYSQSVIERRALSVISWIDWTVQLTEIFS